MQLLTKIADPIDSTIHIATKGLNVYTCDIKLLQQVLM